MNARQRKAALRDLRREQAELETALEQGRPLKTVSMGMCGTVSLCRKSMLRDVRREIRKLEKEGRP